MSGYRPDYWDAVRTGEREEEDFSLPAAIVQAVVDGAANALKNGNVEEAALILNSGRRLLFNKDSRPLPTEETIYRGRCDDGKRCLHGCHRSEECFSEKQRRQPL